MSEYFLNYIKTFININNCLHPTISCCCHQHSFCWATDTSMRLRQHLVISVVPLYMLHFRRSNSLSAALPKTRWHWFCFMHPLMTSTGKIRWQSFFSDWKINLYLWCKTRFFWTNTDAIQQLSLNFHLPHNCIIGLLEMHQFWKKKPLAFW